MHLACFPAYASNRPLPCDQQGWILGSWLTFTQVGFPPTKVRGIAKPQLTPNLTIRIRYAADSAWHMLRTHTRRLSILSLSFLKLEVLVFQYHGK